MLLPKKVAHRKVRIGKNEGVATRGHYVAFGDYGLQSLQNERITSRQTRGQDASEATLAVLAQQQRELEPLGVDERLWVRR